MVYMWKYWVFKSVVEDDSIWIQWSLETKNGQGCCNYRLLFYIYKKQSLSSKSILESIMKKQHFYLEKTTCMSKSIRKRQKRIADRKADSIYAEIGLICMMQFKYLLSLQYYFNNMTNKRTINRIIDITFDEIDLFSKLIINSKILKQDQ